MHFSTQIFPLLTVIFGGIDVSIDRLIDLVCLSIHQAVIDQFV